MKKIVALLCGALLLAGASVTGSAEMVPGATTFTCRFDSMEDLEDWQASYLENPDEPGGTGVKEEPSRHWTIENGKLKRIEDVAGTPELNRVAILTLKNAKFKYFDLSVKYQKQEGSWPWIVVAFAQEVPAQHLAWAGAGVYVQDEGVPALMGTEGFAATGGAVATEGTQIQGYDRGAEHTLRLRLVGRNLELYIDGNKVLTYQNTAQWSSDGKEMEGYISLMSYNNVSVFDDFSITALDEQGNPIPITEEEMPESSRWTQPADQPDATYPVVSEERTQGTAVSLEELAAQGTIRGDPKDQPVGKSGGLSGSVLWIAVCSAVAVVLVAAVVLLARRKRRAGSPLVLGVSSENFDDSSEAGNPLEKMSDNEDGRGSKE